VVVFVEDAAQTWASADVEMGDLVLVALQHSILTAVWHMLTEAADYHDLGSDYFARLDPERAMRRIVRQANALGFTVRFDSIPAA
jgi:transposase